MKHCFVYITASTLQEAENISETIVRERLAACTNIIEGMSSRFHWDDKIQNEDETILIAKTTLDIYPRLEARVRELHSYECPCIIALPIIAGNPGYLDWIDKETHQNNDD